MRRAVALFISFSLACAPVLQAQAQAAAAVPGGLNPSESLDLVRRTIADDLPRGLKSVGGASGAAVDTLLREAGAKRTAEFAGHVGQTLLFILTVSVVDLFVQRFGNPVAGKQPLASQMVGLADEVLNRAGTYFSIVGGAIGGYGTNEAIGVLNKMLADPMSKSLLAQTLASAASLTGVFVAWEAGGHLVREASYLLPDRESYERSQNLFGMTAGALANLIFPTPSNTRDGAIARQMLINVFKVAWLDSELRSKWFDACWRSSMSGEFVSLVSSMFIMGAAGSLIMPGAGTVAGLIFGMAGYALHKWVVPHSWKDNVSETLQEKRRQHLLADLAANEASLKSRSHVINLFQKNTSQLIQQRRQLRSDYWTISFELVRMALKTMLTPNASVTELELAQQRLQRGFDLGFSLCMEELQVFERIRKSANEQERVALSDRIQAEVPRVKLIASFFTELSLQTLAMTSARGGRLVYDSLTQEEKDIMTFVESKFQRGFSEQQTIDLATAKGRP